MRELSGPVPIPFLCRHFEVSRSGYYAFKPARSERRQTKRDSLKQEIKRLFEASKGTHGSPRIFQDLDRKGILCSENTVAELIRNRRKDQNSDSIEGITSNTVNLALIANILNRVGDI